MDFFILLHADDNDNQSNLSHWKHAKFDLELLDDDKCLSDFQFSNRISFIRDMFLDFRIPSKH